MMINISRNTFLVLQHETLITKFTTMFILFDVALHCVFHIVIG